VLLKVEKRKLGTHRRAKKKREEMSTYLRKMRYTSTFRSCILGREYYQRVKEDLLFLTAIRFSHQTMLWPKTNNLKIASKVECNLPSTNALFLKKKIARRD
jgi:hypothetical protein